jgi:BCD family chlorophyll transporter-like MFS transporter
MKRFQITLLHMAVSITALPLEGTLNRIMINDLGIRAAVVGLLLALPYLFSPIQVAIGSYADRHPIFGLRRSPYIALGLVLCISGALLAPRAAFILAEGTALSYLVGVLVFGLWGMGFNFATVSYFSLASELWDKKGRSTTIATMFFFMIVAVIGMSSVIGRIVEPYSVAALYEAFTVVAITAAVMGVGGLIGLEPQRPATTTERHSLHDVTEALWGNRIARRFFIYLALLLVAILGQDLLLEPFGAAAFDLSVAQTTYFSRIWGGMFLVGLVAAALVGRWWPKRRIVRVGAVVTMAGFALLTTSPVVGGLGVFYAGLVILGAGTGMSTTSNLSLMLDMTVVGNVGLFIGAWGMADALARAAGYLFGGVLRDVVAIFSTEVTGYMVVFGSYTLLLLLSLVILDSIDVGAFKEEAASQTNVIGESLGLVGEASGK